MNNSSNLREMLPVIVNPIGEQEVNSVNARDLHKALNSRKDFSSWFKAKVKTSKAIPEKDYTEFKVLLPRKGERRGGSNRRDYIVTLELAKHFAMLENTDTGRAVRQYFIECEEQLQKISLSLKDSLLLGVIRAQEDLDRALALNAYEVQYVVPLENKVQELEPKAEFYDDCVDAEGLLKLKEAAKILGTGRNRLCQFLREHKVFMRNSTEPYQRFVESGWFVVKVIIINGFNHSVTLITGKGLTKIKSLFEKEPIHD